MEKAVLLQHLQQINDARKAGDLDLAYTLAQQLMEINSEHFKIRQAMGWTMYEKLKRALEANNLALFSEIFDQIMPLNLFEEGMLGNQLAWAVSKMCRNVFRTDQEINTDIIEHWLQSVAAFKYERPSKQAGFLLDCALHVSKIAHKDVRSLLAALDYSKFSVEDIHGMGFIRPGRGVSQPTLAEKVLTYVAEQYIISKDKEALTEFLPTLESWVQTYPHFDQLHFFLAKSKWMLQLGPTEVLNVLVPFARRKNNDIRVWQLMAEVYATLDGEKAIACLCKAIVSSKQEGFLVYVRYNLARLFHQMGMDAEAKTELQHVVNFRQSIGKPIPPNIEAFMAEPWYEQATAFKNNWSLYSKYSNTADDLLYPNNPSYIGVITYIDPQGQKVFYRLNKDYAGTFPMKRFRFRFAVGQAYRFRVEEEPGGRLKVLAIYPTRELPPSDLARPFAGIVTQRRPGGPAFVEGIFVPPTLVDSYRLVDGMPVTGWSVITFDKKKDQWGWSAMAINVPGTERQMY